MTEPVKRLLLAPVVSAGTFALFHLTSPILRGDPGFVRAVAVCAVAALGIGAVSAAVSFFCDKRTGLAVSLLLAFLPWTWQGASSGRSLVAAVGGCAIGAVFVLAFILWRLSRGGPEDDEDFQTLPPPVRVPWKDLTFRERLLTVVSWVFFGAAVLFSIVSATLHDYRYGRIGREYAEGVAAEAAGRWVLSNGLLELCPTPRRTPEWTLLSFRETDAESRSQLVARVRRAWSAGTNLWAAAQVSVQSLAVAGLEAHPERFFLLNGQSTDEAAWRTRWEALTPYLASSDPTVTLVRRAMAYEGSGLADRLEGEGRRDAANRLRELVRTKVLAGDGRRLTPPPREHPSVQTVVGWYAAMTNAMGTGAFDAAGRAARRILDQPGWESFAPANATLGALTAREGDYVASERFYRKALAAKAEPDARLCNDFADTLMHLGKLDEAERYARLAIAKASDRNWIVRLTLLEVLTASGKGDPTEIKSLKKTIRLHAPPEARVR